MARMRGIAASRAALPAVSLPRVALPAAGWEQPRPAKTTGGGGTDPGAMEAAIMEALVLWYDPRRQGATNETMDADPRLIDLSGNGHDAECRNFAWGGMSGIGGYTDNLFDSGENRFFSNFATLLSSNTVEIRSSYINDPMGIGFWATASMTPRLILEVSGLIDGHELKVAQYNKALDKSSAVALHNGVNDVQLTFSENYAQQATLYLTKGLSGNKVTVRILPLYPGALVSDGVDDMVTATGVPLLEDFTVIAKREFIRFGQYGAIAFKKDYRGNGAFIFEMSYNKNNATQPDECWVFSNLGGGGNNDITPEAGRVSWMTPASYNGQPLSRGELTDKPELRLFYNGSAVYQNCAAALWSFLLFDRTLSGEEIEWVKEHLMGEPK